MKPESALQESGRNTPARHKCRGRNTCAATAGQEGSGAMLGVTTAREETQVRHLFLFGQNEKLKHKEISDMTWN